MKKIPLFLLILSILSFSVNVSEDYEFCNIGHIQFLRNPDTSISLPLTSISDHYALIGQPEFNFSIDFFAPRKLNYTDHIGPAHPFRFYQISNTSLFFNGANAYYKKTIDGCYSNPMLFYSKLTFDINYSNAPFLLDSNPLYIYSDQNLPRYSEIYYFSEIHLNGLIVPTNEINLTEFLKQIKACGTFEDYSHLSYKGIEIFTPKVATCSRSYVIDSYIAADQVSDSLGFLDVYPLSSFFSLYQLSNFVDSENSYLDSFEKKIPYWGDISNQTTRNCTNQTLDTLTNRLITISSLEDELNRIQINVDQIVPSDYQERSRSFNRNGSDIESASISILISAQKSLNSKISSLQNKLKSSQDIHKDLTLICLQQQSSQTQRDSFQNSLKKDKEDSVLQWISIIFTLMFSFSNFGVDLSSLSSTSKKNYPTATKTELFIFLIILVILFGFSVLLGYFNYELAFIIFFIELTFILILIVCLSHICKKVNRANEVLTELFAAFEDNLLIVWLPVFFLLVWVSLSIIFDMLSGPENYIVGTVLLLAVYSVFLNLIAKINKKLLVLYSAHSLQYIIYLNSATKKYHTKECMYSKSCLTATQLNIPKDFSPCKRCAVKSSQSPQ